MSRLECVLKLTEEDSSPSRCTSPTPVPPQNQPQEAASCHEPNSDESKQTSQEPSSSKFTMHKFAQPTLFSGWQWKRPMKNRSPAAAHDDTVTQPDPTESKPKSAAVMMKKIKSVWPRNSQQAAASSSARNTTTPTSRRHAAAAWFSRRMPKKSEKSPDAQSTRPGKKNDGNEAITTKELFLKYLKTVNEVEPNAEPAAVATPKAEEPSSPSIPTHIAFVTKVNSTLDDLERSLISSDLQPPKGNGDDGNGDDHSVPSSETASTNYDTDDDDDDGSSSTVSCLTLDENFSKDKKTTEKDDSFRPLLRMSTLLAQSPASSSPLCRISTANLDGHDDDDCHDYYCNYSSCNGSSCANTNPAVPVAPSNRRSGSRMRSSFSNTPHAYKSPQVFEFGRIAC